MTITETEYWLLECLEIIRGMPGDPKAAALRDKINAYLLERGKPLTLAEWNAGRAKWRSKMGLT